MNLRGIWAVFRKEFRENLRDRRTLLSALVFGPLMGPLLVAGMVQLHNQIAEIAGRMPDHAEYLARYCPMAA